MVKEFIFLPNSEGLLPLKLFSAYLLHTVFLWMHMPLLILLTLRNAPLPTSFSSGRPTIIRSNTSQKRRHAQTVVMPVVPLRVSSHDSDGVEDCEVGGSLLSETDARDADELHTRNTSGGCDGSRGSGEDERRCARSELPTGGKHAGKDSPLPCIYPRLPVVRYQHGDGRSVLMLAGQDLSGLVAAEVAAAQAPQQLGGGLPGI